MSRRLRDEHQDAAADAIIARDEQRKANAAEWQRRAGHKTTDPKLWAALYAQARLEWPYGR